MDVKRARLYVALLAVVILSLYLLDLGGWIFLTNDEARFPVMARDILTSGHWLVPEIAGTPMLNKPPLHAWLIALASLPVGAVTARTAALPSVITGIGIMLATGWLGARLFGPTAGMISGFLCATTVGLFSMAHVPLPDTTLTLAITAAMCAFALAEFEHRRGALTAFYGATGLAFLAKGPVGLIPLGVALVFALVTSGWRGPRRLLSLPGLVLLGLLVIPWPLLALRTGGHGFVDTVVVNEVHGNYFGLDSLHWRRLTHPFELAATHLLPWAILIPLAAWSAVREPDPERARRLRLPLVWASIAFILTALSERQRWRYYLPLVPPAALLVAAWAERFRARRGAVQIAAACAALVVVALFVGGRYQASNRQRRNDIADVVRMMRSAPAPAFALDSPDIVFEYYLDRAVVPLTEYRDFAGTPGPAYLIASERVARSAPASVDRMAVARVDGRPLVLLKKS